ncbi:ribonuclease E/G-like protein, chloroplastic isoform X1 [Cucurbita maxima]|uniref:Ribonuclease E/G-like protein, chloroplastic isoform X1 n=1 Tax=Cucurbita maxima TaxID=3661 RepID=A0A6J1HYK7_CUCMA|nr:ribonuclease E/G-like protein, chloroplastic isoform X1 [Cucurbita maxima]
MGSPFLYLCASELYHQPLFMAVPEACSWPNHLVLHRRLRFSGPWQLCADKFLSLSPYICRHMPVEKMRFRLCTGQNHYVGGSPIMSTQKGVCKVVWTIEADLEADQLLYLTGDPIALGSWEPNMAIQMSHVDHSNLWKAEVKIARGINFKYNYFIKEESLPSSVIWRTGPEFSLCLPQTVEHNKQIVVRDSWMRFAITRPSVFTWDSWIEELPSKSFPAEDECVFEEECIENDSIEPNINLNGTVIYDKLYSDHEELMDSTSQSSESHRHQPIEEPWLIQLPLFFDPSKNVLELGPDLLKEETTLLETRDHLLEDAANLLPAAGVDTTLDPFSTVILINSSICTMQRIAVLEEGKLVELLLEPVKSNVQCDSVYLGVVSKLVPHMGGAFVNIGNTRPSLMDIKQNREPFIFPPFRQRINKRVVNGSIQGQLTSQDESILTNTKTDGVDDHEDNEVEDGFDVSEVLRENVNGSVVDDDGDLDADFEDCVDDKVHQDGNASNSYSATANYSHGSQSSLLQDEKDSKQTVTAENKWFQVRKGTKIIVQVVKEGLGTKGPTLTAYPQLRSRFWILLTRCGRIGISKKISGVERTRLRVIAKTLQPQGFGLTVRTVAAGHSLEELRKDLEGLISTWKTITEHAKLAALAADEGVEGAVPVILHRAMGQTLSVVQDYFNEKVKRMVVDSPRTYHEVTNYLQEIAPDLCDRVELFKERIPLFDKFNIEEEINSMLSKRVPLANGGSLIIEQTEALVSIDVNGGHGVFGQETSQEKAILEVNLAAARQIARELRLRDIGGIIVVDFIDMADESNKRLVYEEIKKAVERDRSMVKVSELSRHGLMEITRKRVRPSVTFMISEPCACCHATGRVEALETSFSKIEQEICRQLATMKQKTDPENPKSWPKFILRVDHHMCDYLTSGKRTRLAILSSSLKVWIILKVARGFTRGAFEVKSFTDDKLSRSENQAPISLLQPLEGRNNNSSKKVTLFPVKKWKGTGR